MFISKLQFLRILLYFFLFSVKPKAPNYFPMLTYLTIDTANEKQIIGKYILWIYNLKNE